MPRRAASPARSAKQVPRMRLTEESDVGSIAWELAQNGSFRRVDSKPAAATAAATAVAAPTLLSRMASELSSIFLPAGYPESVRPEYLQFQLYDTLQAACSYLRNVLTTSALLKAAGVGEEAASPMAAALAWVLRDGFGMFGSLLFSYFAGANFDVNVKEWRLFADLINDVGLTLDMMAPLAGSLYALTAALGALCKTICGMVAGATRASITAHFALRGNLADVSAKENAQETAVNLLGLLLGSLAARQLGDSPLNAWLAFSVLTVLHVWANWHGVGCLTFEHLNGQRARLVASAWVAARARPAARSVAASASYAYASSYACLSPGAVAQAERIWRPVLTWLRGAQLGVGISALARTRGHRFGTMADANALVDLEAIFACEDYLLRLDGRGVPQVAFRPAADGGSALRALLHCALLTASDASSRAGRTAQPKPASGGIGADEAMELRTSLAECAEAWPAFVRALEEQGWHEASVPIAQFGTTRVHIERAKGE